MSAADTPQHFVSRAASVKSATQAIYYLVVYTSLVLTLVHLLWFNRVVGSIWIGCPLLWHRGTTVLLLLATTQLTAYCYVDFNQRWEIANCAARQERFRMMTANGAVFLEAIVRTSSGQSWLTSIAAPPLGVMDEKAIWVSSNISGFVTQRQNFKLIGLTNIYTQYAYGAHYP
ncbi:Aste57867_14233 [Aphanomyces stellatus]|uniref:Aste57867_14233 protein n=1 Tax=Aphanomyces stellatus TaxID=120398 RepID=A0A485KHV4_9STRA|nr:hypothetical protein As57867_014182 [Aphanomyces stellatus]KAF0705105.1 hypothetical protein As57867_007109 [Aphanomyces stellatus]VFT84065.1 Aste57867_7133 [Aphanomyces stellatus]VFT91058.1 Aste57867_14233 [Aphanomyces stellatus]